MAATMQCASASDTTSAASSGRSPRPTWPATRSFTRSRSVGCMSATPSAAKMWTASPEMAPRDGGRAAWPFCPRPSLLNLLGRRQSGWYCQIRRQRARSSRLWASIFRWRGPYTLGPPTLASPPWTRAPLVRWWWKFRPGRRAPFRSRWPGRERPLRGSQQGSRKARIGASGGGVAGEVAATAAERVVASAPTDSGGGRAKHAPPLAKAVVDVVALKLSVWHFSDRVYFGYMYNFCFCMK